MTTNAARHFRKYWNSSRRQSKVVSARDYQRMSVSATGRWFQQRLNPNWRELPQHEGKEHGLLKIIIRHSQRLHYFRQSLTMSPLSHQNMQTKPRELIRWGSESFLYFMKNRALGSRNSFSQCDSEHISAVVNFGRDNKVRKGCQLMRVCSTARRWPFLGSIFVISIL